MKNKLKLYTPLIFDKSNDFEDIHFLFYHTEVIEFIPTLNTIPVLRNYRFETVIDKKVFENILTQSIGLSQISFNNSYQLDSNKQLRNFEMSYLCYDEIGASNYVKVIRHQIDTSNYHFLMLEANLDISNLFISPYDSLVSYVLRSLNLNESNQTHHIDKLKNLFGNRIEFYIEVLNETQIDKREMVFEMMCNDEELILAHFKNQTKIQSNLGFEYYHSYFSKEIYIDKAKTEIKLLPII